MERGPDRVGASSAEAAERARAALRRGDPAEAAALLVAATSACPIDPEAWHLLGRALRACGRLPEAATAYRSALEIGLGADEVENDLGVVLAEAGDLAGAAACFGRVVERAPGHVGARNNLGNALRALGRPSDALGHLAHVVSLRPDLGEAHDNLGLVLADLGRLDEAVDAHRSALAGRPDHPGFLTHLGRALTLLGRLDEARVSLERAIRHDPGAVEAWNHLGDAEMRSGQGDRAAACFRKALTLDPANADARNHLGALLRSEGRIEEAVAEFRRALECEPSFHEARTNLAVARAELGALDEAETLLGQVLAAEPGLALARVGRAVVWLTRGDFGRGWAEYEWRHHAPEVSLGPSPLPEWDGSPLDGRTVLLRAEQGLGDTLQFVRFAPLVRARVSRVVVQCQAPLVPLLSTGFAGADQVVSNSVEPPPCDVQAPLMSLPRILGVSSLDAIPAKVPYLEPDPGLVARWRSVLSGVPGLRVGIVWQGNPRNPADRLRSVPLAAFAPLAGMEGVRLVSLQKGPGASQLAEGAFALDLSDRLDEANGPFMDTAAVLRNLDLLVTVDSAVAHLAGALGVPTWVVLSRAADWRWLRGRDDTPWYPATRLFRQERLGEWGPVFERIARALGSQPQSVPKSEPILVEVGAGELLDRIAILEIKSERIRDPGKLRHIRLELAELREVRDRRLGNPEWLASVAAALREVNLAIWDNEEAIRAAELSGDLGPRVVEHAWAVCRNNDRRASLKRDVNARTNARIVEEKSYEVDRRAGPG